MHGLACANYVMSLSIVEKDGDGGNCGARPSVLSHDRSSVKASTYKCLG